MPLNYLILFHKVTLKFGISSSSWFMITLRFASHVSPGWCDMVIFCPSLFQKYLCHPLHFGTLPPLDSDGSKNQKWLSLLSTCQNLSQLSFGEYHLSFGSSSHRGAVELSALKKFSIIFSSPFFIYRKTIALNWSNLASTTFHDSINSW